MKLLQSRFVEGVRCHLVEHLGADGDRTVVDAQIVGASEPGASAQGEHEQSAEVQQPLADGPSQAEPMEREDRPAVVDAVAAAAETGEDEPEVIRLPDDPGVAPEDEEQPNRRFRLF